MEEKETEVYYCSECGAKVLLEDKVCSTCGADVSDIVDDAAPDEIVDKNLNKAEEKKGILDGKVPERYPALRTIAAIYHVLACVVAVAAIVAAYYSLASGGTGLPYLILSVIVGIIGVITLIAYAEGILVFLDIEENTRKTFEIMLKHYQDKENNKNA